MSQVFSVNTQLYNTLHSFEKKLTTLRWILHFAACTYRNGVSAPVVRQSKAPDVR